MNGLRMLKNVYLKRWEIHHSFSVYPGFNFLLTVAPDLAKTLWAANLSMDNCLPRGQQMRVHFLKWLTTITLWEEQWLWCVVWMVLYQDPLASLDQTDLKWKRCASGQQDIVRRLWRCLDTSQTQHATFFLARGGSRPCGSRAGGNWPRTKSNVEKVLLSFSRVF